MKRMIAVVTVAAAVVLVSSCTSVPPAGSAANGPTSSGAATPVSGGVWTPASSGAATTASISGGAGSGSPEGPTGMPTMDAADPVRAAALAVAARELQAYLDSWRSTGVANANRRYLASEQQVAPPSGATAAMTGVTAVEPVKLMRGRVSSVALFGWTSSNEFVVFTDLDLVFVGDATSLGNWSGGSNGRFVTFTRSAGAAAYRMSFASSP